MKTLYLIGGPMGVGKTTVCQLLKRRTERCVFLDGDWCWNADPCQVTGETRAMVMDNICHLLNSFLRCSAYETILFCWVLQEQSILEELLSRLNWKGCRVYPVSLVCDRPALRARLEQDVIQGLRAPDVIPRSMSYLPLYDKLDTLRLDTTGKTPEQIAAQLAALPEQCPQGLRSAGPGRMGAEIPVKIIARIHTDFPTKFGIPRQSGLVDSLRGEIVFEPEYRNPDAVRGLEGFSHIWLLWQFSGAVRDTWSPTVRPPRLGGNTRVGVFATRSPFRPNPIGLSSVRLERIELRPEQGPVLHVRGADLMDGTPIYDIKPYLPYADCHPDAAGGFTDQTQRHRLRVECDPTLWQQVPPQDRDALTGVLENDPRPSYQHDPARVYGMEFGALELRFTVDGPVLTVREIRPRHGG